MTRDQLIVAKARFQDLEEKERLNPNNMLIRLLLINLVPFYQKHIIEAAREHYSRAETEEWTDRNRLYAVFVQKQSSVFDLKTKLEEQLGLPFDRTEVFFDNKWIE